MVAPVSRWIVFAAVIAAALWLRLDDLGRRPMHSDEANQAVKFGELLEQGRYEIDARDHHGPTLYYAALPVAWLRGQRTLATLDEVTVRLVPALVGTVAVVLLVFLAWPLGPWPALAAGAFLALSPPAVYYSRYFIQETLLVTFVLLALAGAIRWWRTGRVRWALVAGLGLGLMFATKASAPLFIVAAALGAWASQPPRPASARVRRDVLVAVAVAGFVAVLLLSSCFTHGSGLRDAVAAYGFGAGRATSGSGHEKPWWYYLQLFGLEQRGGLVWQQLGFSALAVCGAGLTALAWRSRGATPPHGGESVCHTLYDKPRGPIQEADEQGAARAARLAKVESGSRPKAHQRAADRRRAVHGPAAAGRGDGAVAAGRFLIPPAARTLLIGTLVATLTIAVLLSAIPYKTPWHVIHLVPGLSVLAAGALALLPRARMGLLFAVLVLFMQGTQTRQAVFERPADERNPYAYVHSSPDVLKLRGLVEAALVARPDLPVRVIGDEYWPIPWYLRGLDRVGYWNTAPADCDGALVLASGSQIEVVQERLRGRYRESYLGLRPDVLCVVFTPQP